MLCLCVDSVTFPSSSHALNMIYAEFAVNFSNQSSESAIMFQYKSIKSAYIIRAFSDIMSIITPEILIRHSVKAILYMVTILCSTGS